MPINTSTACQIVRHTAILATVILVTATLSESTWSQTRYYRYTNQDGVKVMNNKVPPEYVKYGYEIVTLSGEVLEVIAPAPTPEEAEKMAAQRQREMELKNWDEYLLRRYSKIADIEAAKVRKLKDFDASLSILRGNINNIHGQIEQVQARAADMERSGRKVTESTMNRLLFLQSELKDTEQLLALREADKEALAEKYDQDIERFQKILSTRE